MDTHPSNNGPLTHKEGAHARLKRIVLLLALGLLSSLLYIDHTAVNLALPHITFHLNTALSISQWVLSAYDLAWALVVIPAGYFADRMSKRRVCLIGMLLYSAASLVAGMSHSIDLLITARIFQGIGTGLYVPMLYGIIRLYFHESHHGHAIGSLCLWSGIGMALGPFLGGILLEVISWHGIFLLNVPICLLCCLVIYWTKDLEGHKRVTLENTPTHLLTFTLFMFTSAFFLTNLAVEGARLTHHVGLFFLSFVLFAAFVSYERRTHNALFSADLRKSRLFIFSTLCIFLEQFGYTSSIFLVLTYLQISCQLTPLQTALLFLFLTGAYAIYAVLMGRILYKRNYFTLNIFAFLTLFAGSLLFALMPHGVTLWLLVSLLVLGVGMGVAFSSLESSLIRFVPDRSATFAASIFLMISLVGNTMGIVITTSGYTWILERALLPLAKTSQIPLGKLLDNATNVSLTNIHVLPNDVTTHVAHISAQALQHLMVVNIVIYAVALMLCLIFMKRHRD